MHLPDPETLRVFCAAAKHLNFRKGAAEVGLTPAAFGQRIKQLEHMLDVELFHRTTRSIELTQDGSRLLPKAEAALVSLQACLNPALEQSLPNLRVGTRYELGLSWVQPTLDLIAETNESLTYDLVFGDGATLHARLVSQEIDAAIASSSFRHPALEYQPLHEEHYVLVGPPHLKKFSFRDAQDLSLIDESHQLNLFTYWSQLHGDVLGVHHFKTIRTKGTIAAMRQAILNEEGIGVLPLYFVQDDLTCGRLRRLYPKLKLEVDQFHLAFHKHNTHAPLLRKIAQHMTRFPLR